MTNSHPMIQGHKLVSALISEYSHMVGGKLPLFINSPASGVLLQQPKRLMVPAKGRPQEIHQCPRSTEQFTRVPLRGPFNALSPGRMQTTSHIQTVILFAGLEDLSLEMGNKPRGNKRQRKRSSNFDLSL